MKCRLCFIGGWILMGLLFYGFYVFFSGVRVL